MKTDKPLLGVLLILLSGVVLASQDGLFKYLAGLYPVMMVIWLRYTVQCALMLLVFAPQKGRGLLVTRRPWLQLGRGLSLVALSICFFSSLPYLPLGEATAVLFLAPLFVVIFSALFLHEQVTLWHWASVVTGLLGVLMIVRPGGELFTWAVLLPFAGAGCFGVYQLLTRALSKTDSTATSNFLTSLTGTLVTGAILPFVWQTPASLNDWLGLITVGVCAMLGHLLLTHAYRYGSAATLAPFTYGQIVFASLLGALVFGHTPDGLGILGMTVVVASGLLMTRAYRFRT